MADSAAFEWVCDQLESTTTLSRLEVRGTVRLALKQAGLEAASVLPDQMKVVLEKVVPAELGSRGVDGGAEICRRLVAGLAAIDAGSGGAETPDEIFRRLGSG